MGTVRAVAGKKGVAVQEAVEAELVMPEEAVAPGITHEERVQVGDKNHAAKRIRAMEEKLFEQSMTVVTGAMSFADLPFEAQEAPDEWVEELGSQEAADRKFRQIKAGQMSSKDAPAGVKVATGVLMGIMKARQQRNTAGSSINVQMVLLTEQKVRAYPVQKSTSNG